MSNPNRKTESRKKRKTPAEIAQFAADVPPMPTLVTVTPARRTRVGRKVVVKLIEKVKGL